MWNPAFGWISHFTGPALTGLDQYASQPLRAEMQNKKRVDSVDQPLRAGPQYALSGLTAWRCLSVKSSRRLDFTVYTNFSFQKEKLVKRKVYVDLTSLTACEMHFYWHISGLTAWDFTMHFRPYGLKCKKKSRPHLSGRKAWKMLVLALRPAKEKK